MIPKRAALTLVLFLSACDQKKTATDAAPSGTPSALAQPVLLPPTPPPSIGVPECDQYFKLAFECTARLLPELRTPAEGKILANVPGWSALAQTEANRADLVKECTRVLHNLRASADCR